MKKNCCPPYFCCHKYHRIKKYFIFEEVKKKLWTNLQRIIELITQKISVLDPDPELFAGSASGLG